MHVRAPLIRAEVVLELDQVFDEVRVDHDEGPALEGVPVGLQEVLGVVVVV